MLQGNNSLEYRPQSIELRHSSKSETNKLQFNYDRKTRENSIHHGTFKTEGRT